MPTSTFSKSQTRRPRRKRGVKPTTQVKGYQLNKALKQVKRMIPRSEKKYVDVFDNNDTVITQAGTITLLSAINQGTTQNDMVGDNCTIVSNLFRIRITPNATSQMNYLRVMIIRDRQPNGAAPVQADIIETATDVLSALTDLNAERFKVLFDKTYTVDTDANGSQVDKVFRRMKFKYTAQSSGDVRTNAVWLVMLSNDVTDGPLVSYYNRLRFKDN